MTGAQWQTGPPDGPTSSEPDRGAVFLPSPAPGAAGVGGDPVHPAAAADPARPAPSGPRPLDGDERRLLVGVVAGVVASGGFAVGAMLAATSLWGGAPEPASPLVVLVAGVMITVLFPPTLGIFGGLAAVAYAVGRSQLRSRPLNSRNGWSDLSHGMPSLLVRGGCLGAAVSAGTVVGMLMSYSIAGASMEEFVLGASVIAVMTGVIATALVARSPRTTAVIGSAVGATAASTVILAIAVAPT